MCAVCALIFGPNALWEPRAMYGTFVLHICPRFVLKLFLFWAPAPGVC